MHQKMCMYACTEVHTKSNKKKPTTFICTQIFKIKLLSCFLVKNDFSFSFKTVKGKCLKTSVSYFQYLALARI